MDDDFRRPVARVPQIPGTDDPQQQPVNPPPAKHKKPRRFHIWPQHWSTKKKRICTAILIAVLVAVIATVGGYYWYRHTHRPQPVMQAEAPPEPPPTTEISNLTGLEVPIGTNERPVIGVMIENSPDARPQSGLKDAGVVFEAVAEGGITRFLALYQDTQPDYIGPVRSARPYYLDWLMPFSAAYAHVGGSPEALADIRGIGIKDLDQFHNAGAYQRISQRYAPHNVYTSIAALFELAKQKGTSSTFTGFLRKEPAPIEPPTARVIDLRVSSPLYNVHYDYDPATNSYLRVMGGKPHVEERSGAQIAPQVVVALVIPSNVAGDGVHTNYGTVGSGQMFVFQDGTVTQGTWHKAERHSQFTFTDANGQPLAFNPGQTWFTMVKDAAAVTYGP